MERLTEQEKKAVYKMIREKIKKLNDNIGAVTWISTVIVAVIVTLLKFMWYVYQRGKLYFWKIDTTAISIIDDITLYNIFLFFLIGIVMICIMLIPLLIIKLEKKIWRGIIEFAVLFFVFSIIIYKKTGMQSFIEENGIIGIIASGIAILISFIIFFSLSITCGIAISSQKNIRNCNKKTSFKEFILLMIVWLFIMTIYVGIVGYINARSQKNFRITNDGYAIIYETNDYYYLAEYDSENNFVCKNHQIIVKKEDIEYFYSIK